jgi:hypothetical protein
MSGTERRFQDGMSKPDRLHADEKRESLKQAR